MRPCTITILCLIVNVYAKIGPVADLYIRNREIAPDGVRREYVFSLPALFRR